MDTLSYKTRSLNNVTVNKGWLLVDAENQVLGRLSSRVAFLLRGKHKPGFTPHVDCGDNVIVINADKVRLTGKKWTEKEYLSHTGYPGGQRSITPQKLLAKKPTALVEDAVRGMLPRTRLGRAVHHNLFIYAGSEHPHEAQQPQPVKL